MNGEPEEQFELIVGKGRNYTRIGRFWVRDGVIGAALWLLTLGWVAAVVLLVSWWMVLGFVLAAVLMLVAGLVTGKVRFVCGRPR